MFNLVSVQVNVPQTLSWISQVTSALTVEELIFFTVPTQYREVDGSSLWFSICSVPSSEVTVWDCVGCVVLDVEVVVVVLVVLVGVVVVVVLVVLVEGCVVPVTVTVTAGWVTVAVTVPPDAVVVTVTAGWVDVLVTVSVTLLQPPTTSIALSNKHTVIIQIFFNLHLLFTYTKIESS